MAVHVLQFTGLTEQERHAAAPLPVLEQGDQVDLRVRPASGGDERAVSLPPGATALVQAVIGHLLRGGRVAVLAEDEEVSPNDAAAILGMSRPLVVHRMDVGDLPFRYVGAHRRAKLRDVLALNERVDAQTAAMTALAQDTEDFIQHHGL